MLAIEVTSSQGRTISDAALIDTGADTSAFPVHWMRRLGVYKKDCKKRRFATAGGASDQWTYPDDLAATVLGRCIKLRAVFVDTPVALLGREDFLNEFRVAFDQRASRFTIEPYDG